ncbi:MAG: hypothetical protein V3R51_03945 [Gammaproteobacteria bacterium]
MKLLCEHTVTDESGMLLMRSKLRAVSRRMGFPSVKVEQMELVYSELVTNQIKYAQSSGVVQLWETKSPHAALDLFALDYGPGIENLQNASDDGFTTAGTMGKGLGTIQRLCCDHAIYSLPDNKSTDNKWHGVAVWARFHQSKTNGHDKIQYGHYLRSYQDGLHNGDNIYINSANGCVRWLHLDGLGHGKNAADVVRGLGDLVHIDEPIEKRLKILNARLNNGRGAVAILADVDSNAHNVKVSGVGDMACYVIANGARHNIAVAPGVLGHAHRTTEVTSEPFPPQALLLTASDGIRRSWSMEMFPGLWRLHPQFIAFLLGYTLGRNSDDKSLMVLRTSTQ